MAVRKLFLLNTFLALQSLGADIDYYVTKRMSATNNCGDWNQPCATLWDAMASPLKLTNASYNLNNWPSHDLYSGSYQNLIASCSHSFIVHEVHSLHNDSKEIQFTSDLVRVFESTKDKIEASLP
eukprot:439395_1